jgi:hypothetical protein|nr:MAG TPA: hypothetical protein [Herelleviridae sp.]
MPPKDMEKISNNLLFKDVSGNITLFKQLEVVNIGDMDNQEMIETSSVDDMCIEINLKDIVPAHGLTLNDLFLVLFCGYDIEKVRQNNWRKMHGISMRRKRK